MENIQKWKNKNQMSINREFQDKINSRLDNAEKEKISEFEHKATEINKIETGREKNR